MKVSRSLFGWFVFWGLIATLLNFSLILLTPLYYGGESKVSCWNFDGVGEYWTEFVLLIVLWLCVAVELHWRLRELGEQE